MEINDIKIFHEVATLNSTIKAANKLGYVQSNISKRIAKLETELGRTLFLRTNKGMTLTKDGEHFFKYTGKILADFADIERVFEVTKNKIRIGATQSISRNYLQSYYLNDDMDIFTNDSSALVEQLINCNLDLIVVNRELLYDSFEEVQMITEEIAWLKSKKNLYKFQDNTIVVSRDRHCPYRLATLKFLKQNQLEQMNLMEVDTLDILLTMLENEKIIAIMPEKTLGTNDRLEKMDNLVCEDSKIYLYKLKTNAVQFKL